MEKSERGAKNQKKPVPRNPREGALGGRGSGWSECHGQNVTDNEDQGDCGVSRGSGWWMALDHRGESSFRGRWQWLVVGLRGGGMERLS